MPIRGVTSMPPFPQEHGDKTTYEVVDGWPKGTPGMGSPQRVTITRDPYHIEPALANAVNLAMSLGRPLLLQGDPGVGKTSLAKAIADSHELPLECAYVKSTSRAQDLLYTFDAVRRLYDMQTPRGSRRPSALDAARYLRLGPLGRAIVRSQYGQRSVVLIDEIDKADIDFPNDLLRELDDLAFDVPEVPTFRGWSDPDLRPIVIITNNEEKSLPAAFLRRCVFQYIEFPADIGTLDGILEMHAVKRPELRTETANMVLELRNIGLTRPPGLSELLDWAGYLEATDAEQTAATELAHSEALLKTRDDQHRAMKWLQGE